MVSQADGDSITQNLFDGILDGFPGPLIENGEYHLQRLSLSFLLRPPRQLLCNAIQEGHVPLHISSDHRIADAGERDAQPLLLLTQAQLAPLPFADVPEDEHAADDVALSISNRR